MIQPRIDVLMTCYNHAAYVAEQVRSIIGQTWENWTLTVSDNGSTDGSLDILRCFEIDNHDRMRVVAGPGGGFIANVMSLISSIDHAADYYAFCDSDDIWLPDKLMWTMEKLVPLGQGTPAIYCSRSILIDEKNNKIGLSALLNRLPPSFGNALAQCISRNTTLVANRPAIELIGLNAGFQKVNPDWWAYIIVTGSGGHVLYDSRPTALCRLHRANSYNRRPGVKNDAFRVRRAWNDYYKEHVERVLASLSKVEDHLTLGNIARLRALEKLHKGECGPLCRLRLLREAGLCRQSTLESAALYAMALLKLL